jgi:hypothetical protein
LPQLRPLFGVCDAALYLCALAGAILLWRRGRGTPERALAQLLVGAAATRTALVTLAVPLGLTQRLVAQAAPLIIMLAAAGLAGLLERRRLPAG